MNYIIYRTELNTFVKWTDGNVFITNDTDEVADEINIEREKGTSPVAICLSFEKYDDGKTIVKLHSANNIIGEFLYDDDKDFYVKLNDFCNDFTKRSEDMFGK